MNTSEPGIVHNENRKLEVKVPRVKKQSSPPPLNTNLKEMAKRFKNSVKRGVLSPTSPVHSSNIQNTSQPVTAHKIPKVVNQSSTSFSHRHKDHSMSARKTSLFGNAAPSIRPVGLTRNLHSGSGGVTPIDTAGSVDLLHGNNSPSNEDLGAIASDKELASEQLASAHHMGSRMFGDVHNIGEQSVETVYKQMV